MATVVVLYLRSDVAWGKLTEETYVDQEKYSTAVIPISANRMQELLHHIKIWNQCFALSYFKYRQQLKDIADWGHSQITHVDLVLKNRHRLEILRRLKMDDLNSRLANSARPLPLKSFHAEAFVPERRRVFSSLTPPMTRTSVINSIARRFGYQSYLEIGCGQDRNFERVLMSAKTGVDPSRGGTHRMTSDEFFHTQSGRFDLIFIDGHLLEKQVLRDVENALCVLNAGGCILVHDCLPAAAPQKAIPRTTSSWMGDVWKAIVRMRLRSDLDTAVLDRCCGMGAVIRRKNTDPLHITPELSWDAYCSQRDELLRVLQPAEFEQFLSGTNSL
jgi:hypothetical protein